MKRLMIAATTLTLLACGGPELEQAEESSDLTLFNNPCLGILVHNAITESNPMMASPSNCPANSSGEAGDACFFGDACNSGLCLEDPSNPNMGVCAKRGIDTQSCQDTLGPGWIAAYHDFETIISPEPWNVIAMCTFVGSFIADINVSQSVGEVCFKNEDCTGDQMCVHYWDQSFGECGFIPQAPRYSCNGGDHDFSDFFGRDLVSICHH